MNILDKYQNGNYFVSVYSDGTKIREWDENPTPIFPETIDIKITDYCDAGCAYCFESSTKKGIHGNSEYIINLLSGLPAGIEIAIGGGNPLSHPDLNKILQKASEFGLIVNITVNNIHIKEYKDTIQELRKNNLIYGVGISYNKKYEKDIPLIQDSNTVIHLIAGVHNISDVMKFPKNTKILVLGYKKYGFGNKYFETQEVEKCLSSWKYWIGTIMRKFHTSFDNLAIEQLNVRNWLSKETWDEFYMGDDGLFSMYIDGVTQTYSKQSTKSRVPIGKMSIREMFQNVRNNKDFSLNVL